MLALSSAASQGLRDMRQAIHREGRGGLHRATEDQDVRRVCVPGMMLALALALGLCACRDACGGWEDSTCGAL